MDKKPEMVIKGKDLLVKLTGEMKDSTTYTFLLSGCYPRQ